MIHPCPNAGGQGAVIKLRPTAERSPTSLLLENPYSTNTTEYDPAKGLRWRQMKYALSLRLRQDIPIN